MVSPLSAKTILETSQEKINSLDNLNVIEVVICDNDLFNKKDTGLSVALFISVLIMF